MAKRITNINEPSIEEKKEVVIEKENPEIRVEKKEMAKEYPIKVRYFVAGVDTSMTITIDGIEKKYQIKDGLFNVENDESLLCVLRNMGCEILEV